MTQEYEKIIERVARAVCQHEGHDPDKIIAYKSLSAWTLYQSLARAAYAEVLACLEKATPRMEQAGIESGRFDNGVFAPSYDAAFFVWQAMLRAAPRE